MTLPSWMRVLWSTIDAAINSFLCLIRDQFPGWVATLTSFVMTHLRDDQSGVGARSPGNNGSTDRFTRRGDLVEEATAAAKTVKDKLKESVYALCCAATRSCSSLCMPLLAPATGPWWSCSHLAASATTSARKTKRSAVQTKICSWHASD